MSASRRCDGNPDCPDGSDEAFFACVQPSFPARLGEESCGELKTDHKPGVPFPWHAALWREEVTGPRRICAATILSATRAITTAECVAGDDVQPELFTVSAGFDGDHFAEFRSVANITLNPAYSKKVDWQQRTNNLVLLELESALPLGGVIEAACVDARPAHEQIPHERFSAELVSWLGGESSPGTISLEMPSSECWDGIEPQRFYRPGNALLCAVSAKCGHREDVGAGAFTRSGGRWYLRAVLNFPPRTYVPCTSRVLTSLVPNLEFVIRGRARENASVVMEACPPYKLPCDDGQCVSETTVCLRAHCMDGSDMKPSLCESKPSALLLPTRCGLHNGSNNPFQWHAAVWRENPEGVAPSRVCSATVISAELLISSADCFWDSKLGNWSSDSFTITAGYEGEGFAQARSVVRVHTPDDFSRERFLVNHADNVALVHVEPPFELGGAVSAACITERFASGLYSDRDPHGKYVTWTPRGPRLAQLVFFRNEHCRKNVPAHYLPGGGGKICTGEFRPGWG